jgi:uncharacterized protein (TIGR02145 family)
MSARQAIKSSLLKWAHHLNKGTTYGYATRRDWLVVFVFITILQIASYILYYLIGIILNIQMDILQEYSKFIILMIYIPIIADTSLMFMRINDICGKRCFTTKGHIFAFLGIYLLALEGFDGYILKTVFDIKPIIDTKGLLNLLFYLILCVYPSSSKEREEMPVVEYKLPTEFTILLSFIIIAVLGLSLYEATKVAEIAESKVEVAEAEDGPITDDRDEKVYKTVKIGKQIWMAENLNYSDAGRVGKCYDNEPSNCEIYGRLYDWETAKEICPKGWHFPSSDEWDALYQHIGGEDYNTRNVESKLKATIGWKKDIKNEYPGNGTDDYGFTALPGGVCWCVLVYDKISGNKIIDCVNHKFDMLGRKGFWWTTATDEYHSNEPKSWIIDFYPFHLNRMSLMSVRCVKD